MSTMRSASGNGRGRSRTCSTTEKSAVLAPKQTARVNAAVIVNALSFHSSRSPTRTSFNIRTSDGFGGSRVRGVEGSGFRVLEFVRAAADTWVGPYSSGVGADPCVRPSNRSYNAPGFDSMYV